MTGFFPPNLYGSPNTSLANADDWSKNAANCKASWTNNGSYNSEGYPSIYSEFPSINTGCYGYGGNGGYNGYSNYNPFVDSNYTFDKDGKLTSASSEANYGAMALAAIGPIANGFASVVTARINAKTMQQREGLQNMAYQQQSAYMAQMQQRQMSQQNFESSMGMMMNFGMMQKIMDA